MEPWWVIRIANVYACWQLIPRCKAVSFGFTPELPIGSLASGLPITTNSVHEKKQLIFVHASSSSFPFATTLFWWLVYVLNAPATRTTKVYTLKKYPIIQHDAFTTLRWKHSQANMAQSTSSYRSFCMSFDTLCYFATPTTCELLHFARILSCDVT